MPKTIDGATVWDFVHHTGMIAQVDVDWSADRVLGAFWTDATRNAEQRVMFLDGTTADICAGLAYLFKNGFAWCDDCETNREHHDWLGCGYYDATHKCVYERSPFTPEQLALMGPFRPRSMQCYWDGFDAALKGALRDAGKAAS
jgi:hypothetical protein